MRRISVLLIGLLALGVSGTAGADTIDFTGTMKLSLGGLPEIVTVDSGVATVNGTGGGSHLGTLALPGGGFNASTTIPLTDPNNSQLVTLIGDSVTLDGGTFTGISGSPPLVGNTMPINGSFRLCILTIGCSNFLSIPLQTGGGVGVGVGGVLTVNGFGKGTHISVNNAPWTLDQAVITGIFTGNAMLPGESRVTENSTFTGFAHGPASGTSTTALAGARLLFVSPSSVDTNLNSPANFLGLPLEIRLQFVPEPGLILLLGSGVAGLALLGRYRMRG